MVFTYILNLMRGLSLEPVPASLDKKGGKIHEIPMREAPKLQLSTSDFRL